MSSVSIFTEEIFVDKTTSCFFFHVLQIKRRIKKISRRGCARQRNVPKSALHVQNLSFNF